MARSCINFIIIMPLLFGVAFLAFVESGSATKYGSYEKQAAESVQPPMTTTKAPPPNNNPTTACRTRSQLCVTHGSYSCCEGLSCVASIRNALAMGTCLPIPQPPASKQTCRGVNEVCQHYGPSEYRCCGDLACVSTQTLPPAYGISTQNLKLPPGIGLCTL